MSTKTTAAEPIRGRRDPSTVKPIEQKPVDNRPLTDEELASLQEPVTFESEDGDFAEAADDNPDIRFGAVEGEMDELQAIADQEALAVEVDSPGLGLVNQNVEDLQTVRDTKALVAKQKLFLISVPLRNEKEPDWEQYINGAKYSGPRGVPLKVPYPVYAQLIASKEIPHQRAEDAQLRPGRVRLEETVRFG